MPRFISRLWDVVVLAWLWLRGRRPGISEETRAICEQYGEEVIALVVASGYTPRAQELRVIYQTDEKVAQAAAWVDERSRIKLRKERITLALEIVVVLLIGWEIRLGYKQEQLQSRNFDQQLKLALKQSEENENQVSARLVFQDFRWKDFPDKIVLSFDLVNAGNSEATQIERGVGGIMGQGSVSEEELRVQIARQVVDPADSFTLVKDQRQPFEVPITNRQELSKMVSFYHWEKFTYLNVFKQTKTVCGLITYYHKIDWFRVKKNCPSSDFEKKR